jgi:amidase
VQAGRWFDRGSLRTSIGVAGWCPFTSLANFIGNPAASIPAGLTDSGLPVGAHLLARAGDEPTLVAIGAQLENELHWCNARPHL